MGRQEKHSTRTAGEEAARDERSVSVKAREAIPLDHELTRQSNACIARIAI